MPGSIRISLLHLAPKAADIAYNLDRLTDFFEAALSHHPNLIVTPELAVSGYGFYRTIGADWIDECIPAAIQQFSALAQENGVAIILGSPTVDQESGKYHNSAIFIDEHGKVLGQQHKTNVLPGSERWSSPASGAQPIAWNGRRVGMLICADAYSPDIAQNLARQGADVLISPSAWAPGLHQPDGEWEARSSETGIPFFVCNRTGADDTISFECSSSIVAVDGLRVAEYAGKSPAVLSIDVHEENWLPLENRFIVYTEGRKT